MFHRPASLLTHLVSSVARTIWVRLQAVSHALVYDAALVAGSIPGIESWKE
jgi:hypothetical protein